MLTTQYRMHPILSLFLNVQFCNGLLEEGVAAIDRPLPAPKTLWPVIQGEDRSCSLFIDVTGNNKKTRSMSFLNAEETETSGLVLRRLLSVGTNPDTIGVISPYSAQVVSLMRELRVAAIHLGSTSNNSNLQVSSVDGFQGSEVRRKD